MHRTKKIIVTATAAALLMAGGVSSAIADPAPKVTICHRTASDTNPYVMIRVSQRALHAHIGEDAHPPKNGREDKYPTNGSCTDTNQPPPPPPPANDGADCSALSESGNSTQSQQGLVNVGNVNVGADNLLANGFCHSNVGNGLAIAGIGEALGGSTGSDEGDCSAESISGDSNQHQEGLVNVGNVNLGLDNLLANGFCHSDVLNGLAVAGIGDAIGGDTGSGSDDGDCFAESFSGDSDQDQDGAVNVGNINVGGDNVLANAFCQADVLNGLAVSLIGPAIGGSSLGSELLTGGPLGLLSDAPGYLLAGLTTDVRVLASVLVQL